mmetsp:Transcript_26076/g.65527  ORF Transcript_26076/g.65527 Transcript_26076/m.65527 type:complete len:244 (-) Transcript_26076:257-988(-)|eukprot:CAMPEP_0177687620 /NCGR_PEP_ID=MMETSP0447-20121125/34224_1 /TAXON_ID=0 /ORGANISM="Stygamoeba regulata, Strain BSH-02190019" /LENGTH=243 /DNA_ID=CAMNT_0019197871 /DNA_START=144 /DNA_END=875 /DNA_ORIENTATION=+
MTDSVRELNGPLSGWLQKKGVEGLRPGWKRRWFEQEGNEIKYYVSKEKGSPSKGTIDLDKVISVHFAGDQRGGGKWPFQLNTPGRVYHLMAESEDLRQYWVNGLQTLLKRNAAGGQAGASLDASVAADLRKQNDRLRRALDAACAQLGVTPESILSSLDKPAGGAKPKLDQAGAPAAEEEDEAEVLYRAQVLYEFKATREEQLDLKVGEIISILGNHEGGWASARNEQDMFGFVPSSYLTKLE